MTSRSIKTFMVSVVVAASVPYLAPSPATAEIAGVLNCDVAAGQSVLIGSKRDVSCVYKLSTGVSEAYSGTLTDAGIAIGELSPSKMVYNVYGLLYPEKSDLEGVFIGGGIGGSIGLDKGLRADNLVGGVSNAIVLQPASETSTQATGVNFSAGLRSLSLSRAVFQSRK